MCSRCLSLSLFLNIVTTAVAICFREVTASQRADLACDFLPMASQQNKVFNMAST